MEIEPLKSVLEWVDDKRETLLYYFPPDVKEKVINCKYEELMSNTILTLKKQNIWVVS